MHQALGHPAGRLSGLPPLRPSAGRDGARGRQDGGGMGDGADEARAARLELEGEAAERHHRLAEARRASGEILGISAVAPGELTDEFPSDEANGEPSGPLHGADADGIGEGFDSGNGNGGGGGFPGARSRLHGAPAAKPERRGRAGGGAAGPAAPAAAARVDVEAPAPASPAPGLQLPAFGAPPETLSLSFSGLRGFVPSRLKPPGALARVAGALRRVGGGGPRRRERQILHDLSGEVLPGEVLALMGPSGSGKTTLLSVIGGRPAKALRVEGALSVGGRPFTKAVRRQIGFVLQDDVLFEDLTVHETLLTAALLRLPSSMPRAEKEARVEAVIAALGLEKSRGTIIGGFLRRGVSGGERKRVSIGHELLINPSILMLDEPTSGLDSTSALHLVLLLQNLAAEGRAVACTIHQPSSRLYTHLDRLLLLAEGHVLYSGAAGAVADWFAGFGLRVPFGTSIADFVLDAAMGEAGATHSGATGDAAVRELWAAWEARASDGGRARGTAASDHAALGGGGRNGFGGGAGDGFGVAVGGRNAPFGVDGVDDGDGGGKCVAASAASASAGASHGGARGGASWPQQVRVLTARALKVRRFEQLTASHFFTLLFVAAIAGLVWWQRGSTYTLLNATDVMGLLFFIELFPSFRALFHALFTLPNEYRMLLKERPGGLYRLSAYYLARIGADIPIELLNTVLFLTVAYWFGGLNRVAADYFAMLGTMVLVVLVAEAWGLLLGGIFMHARKAQTATTVIMLTFLLVGGYYARNIPVWIGWLRYLSFLFWGFNILTKIQFRRYDYYDCGTTVGAGSTRGVSSAELAATPGCTRVEDLQRTLGLPAPPQQPAWPDALVLIAMLVALRLAAFFVLRVKTRTRLA
ncbi:ABC transporter G family member [Raphidocelis subcapitata]|uniref:ABC transporter G family member n=1 Tax=Raphidocelis subcapitata TaxID=307507 RepID=A0A2V0PIC6_9CHLO|nr:ABC transporter G family member [Raphidocelis subcapitata]|eukprot:GBF97037.1 ABC transporter G family member [Raphidocelis subcapitata]